MRSHIMRVACLALLVGSSPAHQVRAAVKVNVGEMTLNGLTILDIDCRLSGGGFLPGAVLMGALAKRKKPLHACGPKGEATRVEFTLDGNGLVAVSVMAGSNPSTGTCVKRNLRTVRSTLKGRCALTILSGPSKAARAAAKALRRR